MKYKPSLQRRMWLGTVWLNHLEAGLERDDPHELQIGAYSGWWQKLITHPNIDFARGQIEVSETGALHIQVAVHTTDSKRWSWMANNLKAHWEPAQSWDAVIRYVQKTDSRVAPLEDLGTAPKSSKSGGHGSAKLRAIEYLKAGKDPQWIAINDPDAYFTHHRAIDRLYQMVYMAWRGGVNEGEEE